MAWSASVCSFAVLFFGLVAAASASIVIIMLPKPCVRLSHLSARSVLAFQSQFVDAPDVEKLPVGAIRFLGIPVDLAAIAHDVSDELRQLNDT